MNARSYLVVAVVIAAALAACSGSSPVTIASVCVRYAQAVETQTPRPTAGSTPSEFPSDFFSKLAGNADSECKDAARALGLQTANHTAVAVHLSKPQATELVDHMTRGTIYTVPPWQAASGHEPEVSPPSASTGRGRRLASVTPIDRNGLRVYVSTRAGRLPGAGRPTVGGVQLPAGRPARGLPLWVSDRLVPNAVQLAARLANAFPRTGLWPLLWGAGDRPAGYMDGPEGLSGVSRIDVTRVLASRWRANGLETLGRFPGLAAGQARHAPLNPFALFAGSSVEGDIPGPYLLMLVPCRRPADILSLLGYEIAGPVNGTWSAIARSWESRFGAYLVMLTGDGREAFGVQSAPDDTTDAARLAAEILAATSQQSTPIPSLSSLSSPLRGGSILTDTTFEPGLSLSHQAWGLPLGDD